MRIQLFGDLYADIAQIKPITVEPTTDAAFVAADLCQNAKHGFGGLHQIVPVRTSFDYRHGQAPVLCNRPGRGTEHHAFDLALAAEIAA